MKKLISLLLAITLLVACFTGCSSTGTAESTPGTAESKTESTVPTAPQPVKEFTAEDVLGCWYAADRDGSICSLRISGSDDEYSIVRSRFGYDDDQCDFGIFMIRPTQDENGNSAGSIGVAMLGALNGETVDTQPANIKLMDDGTLLYRPVYLYLEELSAAIEAEAPEEELQAIASQYDMYFSRELPVTSFEVTDTTLQGLWYSEAENNAALLMATADGSFVMWQTDDGDAYPTTGVYEKSANGFVFTAKTVEGEAYTDADAAVIFTLNEDNALTDSETMVLNPLQSGVFGKWTAEDNGQTMTLEITEYGMFRLSMGSNEAVGVCFTDGSEISLLYLMNGGYADYDLDVTGTVESDGSLALVNNGESRLFTPLKQG